MSDKGRNQENGEEVPGKKTQLPEGLALSSDLLTGFNFPQLEEEMIQPDDLQLMANFQEPLDIDILSNKVQNPFWMKEFMEYHTNTTFPVATINMDGIVNRAVTQDLTVDVSVMADLVINTTAICAAGSLFQTRRMMEEIFEPPLPKSFLELQNTLETGLVQLTAPSITADVSTISTTTHRASTSQTQTQTVDQDAYPTTNVGEIRPPESRIHDKLIWEDRKWYRRRTREISFHLVDYIFWKAKQTGDLTDASGEEISVGATAAAFFITFTLTGNPVASISVAGAAGGTTFTASKAVQKRGERKELDEKFDSDDE